jgi:phenylalanyl-tRNA synthetase beta chain
MKISEQWLREWVMPRLDARALAERLTLAGLEVGSIAPAAPALEQVVVGEILSVAPHPAADTLRVCRVGIGKNRSLTVVCGAANARVGLKAPLALPGAQLPGGRGIEVVELRGVRSDGVLCSGAELGLGEDSEGLLELDRSAVPGRSLRESLALDDHVLELELTPNRGDCLSVRGLAREVAALTGTRLGGPRLRAVRAGSRRRFEVKLEATADCPHYAGRVIENINPQATTPLWLKERLRRAGGRAIHPVVDVTNYVMFELGQPMHGFDLDRLDSRLVVRYARAGESLVLLDGRTQDVAPGTLLIADRRGPVALAGILGGRDTAVGDDTRHVFLESACFRPEAIAGRARSLGLHTESSHRFERGVDPQLQREALERATELLLAIVGGRPGPVVERQAPRRPSRPRPLQLRSERIECVLGMALPSREVSAILTRLGMRVARGVQGLRVTPPSWRFDIRREVDLIEELARVHGYDRLPSTQPRITMAAAPAPEARLDDERLRAVLVDRDYQEVMTYSFVDPKRQALIDPELVPARLANPISADMAVMRTSLWPGLLQAVAHNQNRQQQRVRLFEIGRRFLPRGGQVDEQPVLAGAASGEALAEQWGLSRRPVDFYDVKGDIEALLGLNSVEYAFQPATHPALHPGQTAEIVSKSAAPAGKVGYLGLLHPRIQAEIGLEGPVVLFELALAPLLAGRIPAYREISKFPAIRRDLAVVVDESTPAASVLERVRAEAGGLLANLELFDVYRGEGIDSGRKSLALGLTLQDSSRTLNEETVEAVLRRVIQALQQELGAQLRQ